MGYHTMLLSLFESKASEHARSMSLNYYGFGRWGADGLVSHHTVNGELVPFVRKAAKSKLASTSPSGAHPSHPHVYEDENLVFHKGAVAQQEFSHKLPTKNKEAACLYLQVMHSLALQSGVGVDEMMKKYNPQGDELYGVSLPRIIKGFSRVEGMDPKVHTAENLDDAIEMIRHGTPVLCMVKTHGALMRSMSKKSRESKKKLEKTGVLDVIAKDESNNEGLYHALMLIGYDKTKRRVLFRDSEPEYAKNGFLSIDIDYFKHKNPNEILKFIAVTPK
jgi:hypothetical protein